MNESTDLSEDVTPQAIVDRFKDLTDMESKYIRYALLDRLLKFTCRNYTIEFLSNGITFIGNTPTC